MQSGRVWKKALWLIKAIETDWACRSSIAWSRLWQATVCWDMLLLWYASWLSGVDRFNNTGLFLRKIVRATIPFPSPLRDQLSQVSETNNGLTSCPLPE